MLKAHRIGEVGGGSLMTRKREDQRYTPCPKQPADRCGANARGGVTLCMGQREEAREGDGRTIRRWELRRALCADACHLRLHVRIKILASQPVLVTRVGRSR